MTVHASAPVRLDFAGGWTDVAPFATERRGVVVNAAIDLRVTVTVELGGSTYRLESKDLGRSKEVGSIAQLAPAGDLALLEAAVRMYRPPPGRIVTSSAAPPGSGLGSSGAVDVALVAALERATGGNVTAAEIAERAWRLEAVEAGLPGGRQDQYAAALGGFHRLEFTRLGVQARPVNLSPRFADLLARRVLVCYTGQSRVSSATIARVMAKFRGGDPTVTEALEELAQLADQMAAALESSDLGAVATLLSRNWNAQCRLDAEMRTPAMAALEAALGAAGALGGKAAGAGAGGTMFFVMDKDASEAASVARGLGATVLPLAWDNQGVRVW